MAAQLAGISSAGAQTNDTGGAGYYDAPAGRDAWAAAGLLPKVGGGRAGFDFTRICWNGQAEGEAGCTGTLKPNYSNNPIPDSSTDWACTRDNVTGFVWSLQVRGGPNGREGALPWIQEKVSGPAAGHNGTANRCGQSSQWRAPNFNELLSMMDFGLQPLIDVNYFPGYLGFDMGSPGNYIQFTTDNRDGLSTQPRVISFEYGLMDDIKITVAESASGQYRPVWSQNLDTRPDLKGSLTSAYVPRNLGYSYYGRDGNVGEFARDFIPPSHLNAIAFEGHSDWRLPNVKEAALLGAITITTTASHGGDGQGPYFLARDGKIYSSHSHFDPITSNRPFSVVRGGNEYSGSPVPPSDTYTVTTTDAVGGKTMCSPLGVVPRGTSITCIPVPDEGFVVDLARRYKLVHATCGLHNTHYKKGRNASRYLPFAPFGEDNSFTIPALVADCNVQFDAFVSVSAAAPGAPTGVHATPTGSGTALVNWIPPANTGSGISQYIVTALLDGQPVNLGCIATPPANSCEVNGLTNGQTYTFLVEAESQGVSSEPSAEPSSPVTPLADFKVFSAPSPAASGDVTATVSGGGDTCGFERVQLLNAAEAGAPANLRLPHGALDFVLSGCDTSQVNVSLSYPEPLPQGAAYWKKLAGNWAPFTEGLAPAGGTMAMLTLVDGQAGDDDGVVNGHIVDPGGVGVMAAPPDEVQPVPTLHQWMVMWLSGLLGLMAWRRWRPACS